MINKTLEAKVNMAIRQRNLFLYLSIILLISNFFLSFTVFRHDKKIILMPGIKNEMSVTGSHFSESYLRTITDMFFSMLLDLNEGNLSYKKDSMLLLTSEYSFNKIENYFENKIAEVKKYKIATYFIPEKLELDLDNLQIKAMGALMSKFGSNGENKQFVNIFMELVQDGNTGVIKLKDFIIEARDEK